MENDDVLRELVLQQLLAQADEQGYLTTDDILELLPEIEDNLDALEELYITFEEEGIRVYTNGDLPAEEEEDEEDTIPDLTAIPTDDTVSLYFGEIRPIPLLTAEQEVDLAKRIEAGEAAAR